MKLIVRIVVSVLILVLATASVANIHTRAIQLHADGGWQTWGISIGFAVTFALFAYMLIAYKKTFFLAAAIFGAILTSVMQTGMYLALGADWITSLGFGFGGPVLEALLAMSEHYMDEPGKQKQTVSPFNVVAVALANRIATQLQPVQSASPPLQAETTIATPQLPEPQDARPVEVSPAALEVLNMQMNGMTVADIAEKIGKSERTVSNYLRTAKQVQQPIIVATNGYHKETA